MHVKDKASQLPHHSAVNKQVQKRGYYYCGVVVLFYSRLPVVIFTHRHDWKCQNIGQLLNCGKSYVCMTFAIKFVLGPQNLEL